MILDLSEAVFVPPEADKYVDIVMNYWDYAFNQTQKDDVLAPPYFPSSVKQAQKVLDEQYPQVARAVDRTIIARSLKRDSAAIT